MEIITADNNSTPEERQRVSPPRGQFVIWRCGELVLCGAHD
jgi:hypothetical protein